MMSLFFSNHPDLIGSVDTDARLCVRISKEREKNEKKGEKGKVKEKRRRVRREVTVGV